jgi:hypothetical protein
VHLGLGIYAFLLLSFIVGLLTLDWIKFGRNMKRLFWFELIVFVTGGVVVAVPTVAQTFANIFGIGRGVDFVVYPIIVWLVRESIVTRYSRWEDQKRIADLSRAVALHSAQTNPK